MGFKYTKNVYKSQIIINNCSESHTKNVRAPLFQGTGCIYLFLLSFIFVLALIYVWYFCAHRPIYLEVKVTA